MIVYNIFFWVCGLSRSLAWDYAPGVPQGEEALVRVPWREKPIGSLIYRYILGNSPPQPLVTAIPPPQKGVGEASGIGIPENIEEGEKLTSIQAPASPRPENESTELPVHVDQTSSTTTSSLKNPRFRRLLQILPLIFEPVNVVIVISLCIALVQPLKALFVDVSSEGGPSWKGPDGRPPLAFIMDTGLSTLLSGLI